MAICRCFKLSEAAAQPGAHGFVFSRALWERKSMLLLLIWYLIKRLYRKR